MTSYAAIHRERHAIDRSSAASAAPVDDEDKPRRTFRSAQRVRFDVEKARLSNIRSITRRIELKREYIGNYRDYIQLVLSEQTGRDDELFITVMVWAIDASEYGLAVNMARYALEKQLAPPSGFTRPLPEIIAEDMAEATLKTNTPDTLADYLIQLLPLLEPEDMADQARAKFYKALGLALHEQEPETALKHYRLALEHNPKISVTRLINRLTKQGY